MADVFGPVLRQSLSDDLAQRIKHLIRSERRQAGDRLPSIAEMARRFGVGHPTLREALKKLETVGLVDIRHGSGIYVGKHPDTLFVSNPILDRRVSKKLLVDLIEARIPIELQSVALAARNASDEQLRKMDELLSVAADNLGNDAVLNPTNMGFHQQIALSSGNSVLYQLLDVLSNLFQQEQRVILDVFGSREQDHSQHVAILNALREADEKLAVGRMRSHLHGVRDALLRWDPERYPVS